jgi:tetratricopeptide (TPR) repeat protein
VQSSRERTLTLITFLAFAVTVFCVYARAIDVPFIFDDLPGIVNNPSIGRLWPLIGDSRNRGPLNPPPLAPTARRPLPNLTLALNYHFGGLRPAGYHVFNLVVHVLSAAVLASIVRRTLRLPYFGGALDGVAWPLSLAVALVWAVHPLNTEAVVYVTQRTELLVALFYLLTLWAALRYWSADSRATHAVSLVVAVLACLGGAMSKEVIVSAPLVLLLYERTFLVGSLRAARRSWPLYAGLMLSWVLLSLLSSGGIGGLSDPRHRVPILVWWATQAKVLLVYLKLVLWPWPLSIHYAPVFLRTFDAAWPWVAGVTILTAAALALVWPRPAVRFVAAAVVLLLAPTLLVPLPKMVAAERRMYVPLAGILTLALVGGYRLISERWPSARTRLSAVVAMTLLLGFSFMTVRRLAAYESAVTIWQDAVLHQPDDPMAHYNLGVALLEEGRPPEDAKAQFEHALRLDPEHTGALDNLGMLLDRLGRPREAMTFFERALRIEPDDAVAHNNLGSVLIGLGRPEEAIAHLNLALTLKPDEPKSKVHLNLGRALMDTGRPQDAIAHLERAVRLQPNDADAHYSLGVALTNLGRPGDAIGHLEQALRLKPDDPEAYNALGSALLGTGDAQRAAEHYEHALELKPDYAEAHNNLGTVLVDLGRIHDAIGQFEQALRSNPENANAHYNLASALLNTGRPRDAIRHFHQALRLGADDAQARFRCAIAYARSGEPSEAVAMAEQALALARSRAETDLADEIDAWLTSYRVSLR